MTNKQFAARPNFLSSPSKCLGIVIEIPFATSFEDAKIRFHELCMRIPHPPTVISLELVERDTKESVWRPTGEVYALFFC